MPGKTNISTLLAWSLGSIILLNIAMVLATHVKSSGAIDIARNVERIAQMTGENSQAVDKTSEAAHQLEVIAASLEKSIGYFRL